ncbi:3'-5' exonuclease [Aquibacillus salsiterrae]|uniref:3'-5' exonuclease n=1 Tax=Aquibacillus salsiterrae TaxID=2950439 RepID=A0A9X4AHB1_9BACI|nr:3'-5' exonuclease [Aquibacillus salsiterrae]MDC3417998.1 3'-5' exonuclease [Aquibacillus salsiterrae]
MNFVAIDFETANSKRDSPCSIGIVTANKAGIINEYYTLINPLMEFDSFHTYIHGITEQDVIAAPTFEEVWPEISKLLNNQLLVAHNASFDMSVLRHTLDRFHLDYPTCEYFCSVTLSKRVWTGLLNYKLNTLAEFNQIEFIHHDALEDARVASRIVSKAMEKYALENVLALNELHGIQHGQIYQNGYVPPKTRKRTSLKK